jgi:hypothetical protein
MSSTREKLERARAEQRLVRIERRLQFADRHDGFVVAVGAKWLLLRRAVDGGHPDGFIAMRLRDVKSVSRDHSFSSSVARSLASWPPTAPSGVRLDSTAELLASVGADGQLVGIERESLRSALWIGQVVEVKNKRLWMHELDTKARRSKKAAAYALKDITCVMFGDRYLGSLALAASERQPAGSVT